MNNFFSVSGGQLDLFSIIGVALCAAFFISAIIFNAGDLIITRAAKKSWHGRVDNRHTYKIMLWGSYCTGCCVFIAVYMFLY